MFFLGFGAYLAVSIFTYRLIYPNLNYPIIFVDHDLAINDLCLRKPFKRRHTSLNFLV